MRGGLAAVLVAGLVPLLFQGCHASPRLYSTWASLGTQPVKAAAVDVEELPPAGAFPWAGTVSHHLLAGELIDRWFAELARLRSVRVFYILSPSHWGLSTLRYSLTDGAWRVPGGLVESDPGRVGRLAGLLGVALEPTVFDPEHGVSTLMPYLMKHFPGAKVVAVAYRGEPPLDQPMASRLAGALAPAFDRRGREDNFLLISTDFAHHGNLAGTVAKDNRTRQFFQAPSLDTWIFAGCDNRPGMYVIGHLLDAATRASVLYHANSWQLSGGLDADDITSYFFTYFWQTH